MIHSIWTRIRVMWHVLRGRPAMYRMVTGSVTIYNDRNAMLAECTFHVATDAPYAIEFYNLPTPWSWSAGGPGGSV